jgi:hypothetical protein
MGALAASNSTQYLNEEVVYGSLCERILVMGIEKCSFFLVNMNKYVATYFRTIFIISKNKMAALRNDKN